MNFRTESSEELSPDISPSRSNHFTKRLPIRYSQLPLRLSLAFNGTFHWAVPSSSRPFSSEPLSSPSLSSTPQSLTLLTLTFALMLPQLHPTTSFFPIPNQTSCTTRSLKIKYSRHPQNANHKRAIPIGHEVRHPHQTTCHPRISAQYFLVARKE